MVSIIYDTCETTHCRNLALPNQRYCAVCQSNLVDGHTRPPRINARRTPPDEVICQLQSYIDVLLTEKRRTHQRVMQLTDQLDREAVYSDSQQKQLEALRRVLVHNLTCNDLPEVRDYVRELERQVEQLRRKVVRPGLSSNGNGHDDETTNDGPKSAIARLIRRLVG